MVTLDPIVLAVNSTLLVALLADLRQRRRQGHATMTAKQTADRPPRLALESGAAAPEAVSIKSIANDARESDSDPRPAAERPENASPTPRPMRFLVPSLLLSQSFRHVCPPLAEMRSRSNGFREEFHYATGVVIDDATCVVTHIIPVTYAHQSAGGLRVADGSNITALANLDRLGLPLLAHFHSHPGFGRNANRPSLTDCQFQERLERGGHKAIGAIFTRDAFVRWFAGDLDRFVVEVQGKNVRKVADNEFQLELDHESL